MFSTNKQPLWYQLSFFYILLPCLLMLLTACINQTPVDHQLTYNGSIISSTTPGTTATTQNKTIQPIAIVADRSQLSSFANGTMSLTITTSPDTICNFIVSYGMDTPSKAFGIKPVTANADGLASWQWRVESKALTGIWPLRVTATSINGTQTSRNVSVTVSLPPLRLDTTKSMLTMKRKGSATLAIVTAPSTACIVTISYPAHPKTLKGTADIQGAISWTWRVETGATPGTYPLIVTITTGSGEQEKATFSMVIQ